ncbi:MAG: sodium:solute symporter [Pirellulales bacterium]
MTAIDWWVVVGYFAVILGLAWWVILQSKDTASDYFLAGRHLGWFVIGASIFASNIGSEHLVGLAGSGATDGVAMAHYELHAWCLLVLAWVMVPFYMRSKVFTMPEFLERRFNASARTLLSVISLVAYVITKIAVGIFAGGIVSATLMPEWKIELGFMTLDSFWIGSILVVLATGVYTVLGGMRAVAYTEALQTIVLIVGSVLVTYYGLQALGGVQEGWQKMRTLVDEDPSDPFVEKFNLWKPVMPANGNLWEPRIVKGDDGKIVNQAWYFNGNYPWLGMLFCAPIIGLWYWCTDQYIVQRALGAPNETQARRGSIFAGFLKLLPVFIFIIPGIICFALAKEGNHPTLNALVGPDGNAVAEQSQAAFPLMVRDVLPDGIRGAVVAGLLAALMSSLAGAFNASSTLFTIDLYQKFRPNSSDAQLVWVGRMATVAMTVIALIWIPVIRNAPKGLYDYLQSIQGYLAPPIFVVFFLGVFWKRLNGAGCLAALIVGFIMGIFRLAVDTPITLKLIEGHPEGSFLWIVNHLYFQYYSLLIFLVSVIVMVLVSLMTAAPNEAQIRGLTYGTTTDEQRRATRESWSAIDIFWSAVVLVAIIAAYLYFRG